MWMRRHVKWGALVVLAGLGVAAGVFLSAGNASTTRTKVRRVTITVVAREWSFKLSRRSVPAGTTVVFRVVNRGKIGHNFVIAGKKTRILPPGKSATLIVRFTRKTRLVYVCSVPGHAKLGMKGTFAVGVAPPPPPKTTTATTTTTPANVGTAKTTVTVDMVEYAFKLSQATIPSGQVTFVVKNDGAEVHNFDINGKHSGALLAPGATETWTVALPPGQYLYTCDVPFHVDRGMTGTFQVTP
jgi:uncharacterized cupredoxin-like copper-binding protein